MKRLFLPLVAICLGSHSGNESDIPSRIKQLLWNGELPSEVKIDSAGTITIYTPGSRQPEFHLPADKIASCATYFDQPFKANWKQYNNGSFAPVLMGVSVPKKKSDSLPLQGIRIALDPGHFAGDYPTARLERKSVQLLTDTIIEGRLTLITAKLLQKKLEALGATVMLTRDADNHTSFGKTFDQWLKEDKKRCLDSAYSQGHISIKEKSAFLKSTDRKYICREFFLQEDLRERARKINAFDPDLAIIIHFNVDEKNTGWTQTTTKNFSMCFVPGAIFPGALTKKEARFNLLRLLVSDHYPRSVRAAQKICRHFEKDLGVPLAGSGDAGYLKDHCLYTGTPGVFSRNLALTRLPHCPVVYGETLYQDNEKEYKNLSLAALRTTLIPPRLEQVATAYCKGILEYFSD